MSVRLPYPWCTCLATPSPPAVPSFLDSSSQATFPYQAATASLASFLVVDLVASCQGACLDGLASAASRSEEYSFHVDLAKAASCCSEPSFGLEDLSSFTLSFSS